MNIVETQQTTSRRTYCETYEAAMLACIDFNAAIEKTRAKRYIAIDIESTGVEPLVDVPTFVQFYHHDYGTLIMDVRRIGIERVASILKVFMDSDWLWVGHNLKFDFSFIKHHFGVMSYNLYDTMIAELLLTAGLAEFAALKDVAAKYVGVEMNKDLREEFLTLGSRDVSPELLDYMAWDVEVLPEIKQKQTTLLKQKGLVETARLEFAVTPVLVEAELHGVKIDPERWNAHVANLEAEAERIRAELQEELQPYIDRYRERKQAAEMSAYTMALANYTNEASSREARALMFKERMLAEGKEKGEAHKLMNEWKRMRPMTTKRPPKPKCGTGPINLDSPTQLQGALGEMGVKLPVKENGQLETDRYALRWVESEYPIIAKILEYRGLSKLVSAFGDAVTKYLDEGGRLHPEYRQLVSTGRMACSKPNIQQVPGNKLGAEFRHCFVAPEGYKIISADYSQIELRILYELAEQEDTIEAINSGLDLHSLTTANMFKMDYDHVRENYEHDQSLKEKRRAAKAINFGIAYGLSPAGLSRNERIPLADAKVYIREWEQANPKVVEWLNRIKERGLTNLYAETMLGRKRFFHSINGLDRGAQIRRQRSYERMIGNHPIQGTSADITKLAAVAIAASLRTGVYDAHPIMFVHDEIVVEAKAEDAEAVADLMRREMISAATMFLKRVDVEVGCSIADHWEH